METEYHDYILIRTNDPIIQKKMELSPYLYVIKDLFLNLVRCEGEMIADDGEQRVFAIAMIEKTDSNSRIVVREEDGTEWEFWSNQD